LKAIPTSIRSARTPPSRNGRVLCDSGVTHVSYEPATSEPLEVELVRGAVNPEDTEPAGVAERGGAVGDVED